MSDHPFPPEVEQACIQALYEAGIIFERVKAARIVLAKLAEFGEWEDGAPQLENGKWTVTVRRWTYATPWQEDE